MMPPCPAKLGSATRMSPGWSIAGAMRFSSRSSIKRGRGRVAWEVPLWRGLDLRVACRRCAGKNMVKLLRFERLNGRHLGTANSGGGDLPFTTRSARVSPQYADSTALPCSGQSPGHRNCAYSNVETTDLMAISTHLAAGHDTHPGLPEQPQPAPPPKRQFPHDGGQTKLLKELLRER
jgi:hypothetical protein